MTAIHELACSECERTQCDQREVLRSVSWEGATPSPGDIVRQGDRLAVVEWVIEGPGVGHYTLVACDRRVIDWTPA